MVETVAKRKRKVSPNLTHLHACLNSPVHSGAVLEGSTRSMKTWSSVDFLIYLCSVVEKDSVINIIKETYNSFKTTLYSDFNRRLPMYGIPSPFAGKKEVSSFYLFGNQINLLGADSDSVLHGVGSDYFYINEALDVDQNVFDQLEQRCRKFWWIDYNPKATHHWVYDRICNRKDVGFLKTTFKDNPYISEPELRKVLSYQPIGYTEVAKYFGAEDSDEKKRVAAIHKARDYKAVLNLINFSALALQELERSKQNEEQGTADDYMWQVYGLGARTAPEGAVFPHVTWIKKFPEGIEQNYYGSDIGHTVSPSTVVRVGVEGRNIYLEKLFHEPTPSSVSYTEALRYTVGANDVWSDSAEPGYISDAQQAGLNVYAIRKFAGSIKYGIGILKGYKIHIVDCPEWRKEQSSYLYRKINGIKLDDPIDEYNHLWDAARYAALAYLRPN